MGWASGGTDIPGGADIPADADIPGANVPGCGTITG